MLLSLLPISISVCNNGLPSCVVLRESDFDSDFDNEDDGSIAAVGVGVVIDFLLSDGSFWLSAHAAVFFI